MHEHFKYFLQILDTSLTTLAGEDWITLQSPISELQNSIKMVDKYLLNKEPILI